MMGEEPTQSHSAPRKEMEYWVDLVDFDFPMAISRAGFGLLSW